MTKEYRGRFEVYLTGPNTFDNIQKLMDIAKETQNDAHTISSMLTSFNTEIKKETAVEDGKISKIKTSP